MLTEATLTGAVTDLAAGLLLLPLLPLLRKRDSAKKREKGLWLLFFGFLTAADLGGFAVHYFCRTPFALRLCWAPLYALLYGTACSFFLLAAEIRREGRPPERRAEMALLWGTVGLLALTVALESGFGRDAILLFVGYAALLGLAALGMLVRPAMEGNRTARGCFFALLPLLPAGYLQLTRNASVKLLWEFDHNGLTHLFVIVSELWLFAVAMRSLRSLREK